MMQPTLLLSQPPWIRYPLSSEIWLSEHLGRQHFDMVSLVGGVILVLMASQSTSIYTPGTPFDPSNLPEGTDVNRLLRERFGFDAELDMEFPDAEGDTLLDANDVLAELLASEASDPDSDLLEPPASRLHRVRNKFKRSR